MRKSVLVLGALLAASVAFAAEHPRVFVGLDTKTVTNSWEGYFQDSFEWSAKDHHYKWVAEEAGGSTGRPHSLARFLERGDRCCIALKRVLFLDPSHGVVGERTVPISSRAALRGDDADS